MAAQPRAAFASASNQLVPAAALVGCRGMMLDRGILSWLAHAFPLEVPNQAWVDHDLAVAEVLADDCRHERHSRVVALSRVTRQRVVVLGPEVEVPTPRFANRVEPTLGRRIDEAK
jgi:hypothetical protein